MKWATKAPTMSGWYWYRDKRGETPYILQLGKLPYSRDLGIWIASDGSIVDDVIPGHGEWWGPIKVPE
jgi:hypothetical protein